MRPDTCSRIRYDWIPAIAAAVMLAVGMGHSGTGRCATQQPAPGTPPPAATADTVLRLSGSTTIGDEAAPLLVRGWLASLGANEQSLQSRPLVEIDEKTREQKQVGEIISGAVNGKAVQVSIRRRGSGSGFVDLGKSLADVAMASREINAKEIADLKQAGVGDMKSYFAENIIGLDGIAIIVARDNPVKSLSIKQVHDIFTGRVQDWSEVGGSGGPISRYIRTPGSGTYDSFRDLVLGADSVSNPTAVIEDSKQIDSRVGNDPAAIGFVSSGLVSESKRVAVGQEGYRLLMPSITTIKTENYILRRRLYLYLKEAAPRDFNAASFVAYAKSNDGQTRMRQAHLVDLIPLPTTGAENAADESGGHTSCVLSDDYQKLYHHSVHALCELHDSYRKLQTSFYFDHGAADIDNLGMDQVKRVIDQIQAAHSKEVIFAGFADSSGAYARNCTLALGRAEKVAEYFRQFQIVTAKTVSFCSEAPLVDSSSEEGLRQNRRVEVYIK